MIHNNESAAQVVLLHQYRNNMHHPAMKQIEAYWQGLRNGRAVPLRADVDPRGISRALEFAFILERIAPGLARFRLAGMHLNELMGMEVRGMPVTSFFVPESRTSISDTLEHVFEEPACARLRLSSAPGLGKPALTGSLVLLPLKSDLGDISRALGCLVTDGDAGRTPRRFSIEHTEITPVSENPQLAADAEPEQEAPVEVEPGFAEAAPIFQTQRKDTPESPFSEAPESETALDGADRPNSERPYLKLIHSTD